LIGALIDYYLNNVSLLVHTRLRTTTFQKNNPVSTKNANIKTFCSIDILVGNGAFEHVEDFVSFPLLLSTSVSFRFLKSVLLHPAVDANLLNPKTTSIQNPMLQKESNF